jgi:hypothetical protein
MDLWLINIPLRILCVASLSAHLAILSNAKSAKMFAKDRKDEYLIKYACTPVAHSDLGNYKLYTTNYKLP